MSVVARHELAGQHGADAEESKGATQPRRAEKVVLGIPPFAQLALAGQHGADAEESEGIATQPR